MNNERPHRGTIFPELCEILRHEAHAGDQYTLRVRAPLTASAALPGSFAHIQCDRSLPMRRPLSIMRTHAREGWVDFLYKAVGEGTRALSRRTVGEQLDLLGPIGRPFTPDRQRPRGLLLGGGVGLPPMIFLADRMRDIEGQKPVVLLGSEVPFPFPTRPSQILMPGMPDGVIAAMPLLDDWGIPSRLTSMQGYAGCHEGYVTDLGRAWLRELDEDARNEVTLYACGPMPMLAAVAALAREFGLPCQVSIEEHMACAVGGCAGCTVEVIEANKPAMRRVCVDGPVFDAETVVLLTEQGAA